MAKHRLEKVGEALLRAISEIIQRRVQDPRVRGVHLTGVEVSPDLHLARVFYSTLNQEAKPEDVQRGLDSAKHLIRSDLRNHVQMRVIPELAFKFDPTLSSGDQLLGLLRKLQADRGETPPPAPTIPKKRPAGEEDVADDLDGDAGERDFVDEVPEDAQDAEELKKIDGGTG